jgi:hypothetical protein
MLTLSEIFKAHRGFLILRDDAAGRSRYPLDDARAKYDV